MMDLPWRMRAWRFPLALEVEELQPLLENEGSHGWLQLTVFENCLLVQNQVGTGGMLLT